MDKGKKAQAELVGRFMDLGYEVSGRSGGDVVLRKEYKRGVWIEQIVTAEGLSLRPKTKTL